MIIPIKLRDIALEVRCIPYIKNNKYKYNILNICMKDEIIDISSLLGKTQRKELQLLLNKVEYEP